MQIFYAVQATGNGHISRARQLMPYLQQYGEVDVFLSGANAIINDFDFITAKACASRGIPSVQFGHQASFMSAHTPRPQTRSLVGELILRQYAPATHYVGLHFLPYDSFIFPPVIKPFFLQAQPQDQGHITVYLPAYQQHCLESHFRSLPDIHFHWFLPGTKGIVRQGNITFYPISEEGFNRSLLHCHGLITGGGFETPAEALYLGKRLLSIPIRGQYEQRCNAAALEQLGITVLEDADTPHFAQDIRHWLNKPQAPYRQQANDIGHTLEHVVSLAAQPARDAVA
ncbi:MAG: glycosyl transferase [Chitinophagaceae bacterium]|nr:glycosyl transferase [Chitinophagaceae bacterium]